MAVSNLQTAIGFVLVREL